MINLVPKEPVSHDSYVYKLYLDVHPCHVYNRQTDRQTDRNVYLTKMNKIHKIIFRKNCGRETSTKTIYSRSRGGRVTNVSYTGVSYTAKLQRFVYKLCNVSYTLRVCIPCLLNI